MMRRWLICFRILAALALAQARASTISGDVQLVSNANSHREQNNHLTDIVVWLESPDSAGSSVSHPHAVMLQKDKMFHPHVLPILVGTAVDFPNADPIFHNAFSNYDGQMFDVALYPPGTSRSVVFRKPGVVRVFCNIHPTMSAIILVLKTPYFAKVDADGRFHIKNVPAGQYDLHYYDERATGGNETVLRLAVDNAATDVTAPALHVSEAGYVTPPPHKNKYGLEYPSETRSYNDAIGPPR